MNRTSNHPQHEDLGDNIQVLLDRYIDKDVHLSPLLGSLSALMSVAWAIQTYIIDEEHLGNAGWITISV